MIKKFLLNLKLWYMIKKCEYSHRKWLKSANELERWYKDGNIY